MKRIILLTFLLISGICYAANEIRAYYASGSTLYAIERNSTGQAFDTTGNAFEAWNIMTDYDIALTDHTGGMYTGTFDADTPAGLYTIMIYKQIGVNPADSDPPIMYEEGMWSGSAWFSDSKQLDEIKTDTGTTIPALINDVNTNLETAIGNITVDNGAIADEVVLHMDANSQKLIDINTATGTTIPGLIAALVVPDAAGTAAALHVITDGLISGLNNISIADVNTAVTSRLNLYDPPTKAELDLGLAGISVDANDIWEAVVEGSYTYKDYMRLFASKMLWLVSGGGTTSHIYKDYAGTKTRITETIDAMGNRTSITVDPND